MRVETRTETVVKEINTYIADDGREFDTKEDCVRYENKKAEYEALDKLKELSIDDLEDVFPLHSDLEEFSSWSGMRWYFVESRENVENIEKLYDQAGYKTSYYDSSYDDMTYPNYIGIEEEDNEICGPYTLEKMKKRVVNYFKNHFNIIVEYKKGE